MNSILIKIKEIMNENLKHYLPKVQNSDLEENGTIYYMNGNDGTEFDWYVNERLPEFMIFYDDKEKLGAMKLMLYQNGGVVLYIYADRGKKVIKEINTAIEVAEKDLFNLAVILKSEADDKRIWDANIDKINTDVEITDEKITEFQNSKQYMELMINKMNILNNQTAYLSKKIIEEGWKVGYMYRDEATNESDSGWSFMAGNEDDEFLNDYKNCLLVHVRDVYHLDPDIWNYIDSPVGTELIRISSNEFEIDKKDKEIFMEKRET